MDHPTRSSQISLGPTVQQQENWAVRKSRLLSDGQITELRNHIYHFDDGKGLCFGLDECTVYRSSPRSMPRFIICSTRKIVEPSICLSNLNMLQFSKNGLHEWFHRNNITWIPLLACADLTEAHQILTVRGLAILMFVTKCLDWHSTHKSYET